MFKEYTSSTSTSQSLLSFSNSSSTSLLLSQVSFNFELRSINSIAFPWVDLKVKFANSAGNKGDEILDFIWLMYSSIEPLLVLQTQSPFNTKPDHMKQYGMKKFCKKSMNGSLKFIFGRSFVFSLIIVVVSNSRKCLANLELVLIHLLKL